MSPLLNVILLAQVAARTLTLDQAVQSAEANHPALKQARAQSALAEAQADSARAPLLPQVTATASYRRTTGNRVYRAGTDPRVLANAKPLSGELWNYYNFGITGTQLIYDWGQSIDVYRAARVNSAAQAELEGATRLEVVFRVRLAYYAARAQRELGEVARHALENQERHLEQVEGFVKAKLRPEIDLAQARLDVSNARLQVANAASGYTSAKAELTRAMGVQPDADYDVGDVPLDATSQEGASVESLRANALKHRVELNALDKQVESRRISVSAARGGYGPSLSVSASATDAGIDFDHLRWNYYGQVTLSWHLFQGLKTPAQVSEAHAELDASTAERDALRQQVEAEVDKAQAATQAAKEAVKAANDAVDNAHERLRLAEGRYQAGIANALEFGDAQLASVAAEVQRVQSEYALLSARAALLRALGTR
ncbi:MAG: TolC family protein [Polyangiaceae bacterium]